MTFDQIFFHSSPSLLSVFGTLIIVFSAIYVAVRIPMRGLTNGYFRCADRGGPQVTKVDTGKHKRARSQVVSAEDISLEEGLLADQDDAADEPPSKEAPVQDAPRS